MFTLTGLQDIPEPRTLRTDEIPAVIQEFRHAAASARKAGAEGVELHGANGYLIHQFLSDNVNLRTDQFGGSIARKIRFAVEVASAVADEIGSNVMCFGLEIPGCFAGGRRGSKRRSI